MIVILNGDVGEVTYINADFSFLSNAPDSSRLFDPALAGGALLDIGIYPLFLAYTILGIPERVQSNAIFHRTGVDLQTSAILSYKNSLVNISCGFNSSSDMIARIHGTKGSIFIDAPWHESSGYWIVLDGDKEYCSLPKIGYGYTYEIEECFSCITSGRNESASWPHQDSLVLIGFCDQIRKQVELVYPFESH